jgi:hypothetical protein
MYRKVPPLVLDMTEPVVIVRGAAYEDGGTTILAIKDATNKVRVFHLDRKIGSPTRNALFIYGQNQPRKAIVLRGAEEAALYGLLLRIELPAQIDAKTAFGFQVMLGNLDDRFAAE